jgi:hypothetical protein
VIAPHLEVLAGREVEQLGAAALDQQLPDRVARIPDSSEVN